MSAKTTARRKAGPPVHPVRTREIWFPAWATALIVSALAVAFDPGPWLALWNGDLPRAWDGAGHYAVAKQYAETVFPDVFGWLPNYTAGTPFPNYYPPLFPWLVAALASWTPLTFAWAFKLVLAGAALSVPVSAWLLARGASRRSAVALLAAVAVFPLLADKRSYYPIGLSHPSVILAGLYSQPLGFFVVALWYRLFARAKRRPQFLLSALVLALAFLAHFFAASLAVLLWAGTTGYTVFRAYGAVAPKVRRRFVRIAAWQGATLAMALLLAAFWLAPVLLDGSFFVTRPIQTPPMELSSALLPVWYVAAAAGMLLWFRRRTAAAVPFALTIGLGYAGLWIASQDVMAPWFPLQIPRFLSCLNFLLAVPVGIAVSEASASVRKRLRPLRFRYAPVPVAASAAALLLVLWPLVQRADYRLAFYSGANQDFRRIDPILQFAREHRDGMYVVEQVPFSAVGPALDARSLSAYLGMQGNETAGFVFREAPISSELLYPLAGAMSAGRDTYGLSSILEEDIDFLRQGMQTHLDQAELYRVRYFVAISRQAKSRMAQVPPERYAKYDFGSWSVFELKAAPRPQAMGMSRRPVLVLTSFSAKLTRRSDFDFLRLAEEEFLDSPGMPIAFHPDYRADGLPDPALFSALIVESYRNGSANAAFEAIQRFSRSKPVVLVEADGPLFRLLWDRRGELGKVAFVPRVPANDDRWVGGGGRGFSYRRNSVRLTWRRVKSALAPLLEDSGVDPPAICDVTRAPGVQRIRCDTGGGPAVPVSLATSFHPNWQAVDGGPVTMLNPSLTYATVQGTAELRFRRRGWENAAWLVSALTLTVVAGFLLFCRS